MHLLLRLQTASCSAGNSVRIRQHTDPETLLVSKCFKSRFAAIEVRLKLLIQDGSRSYCRESHCCKHSCWFRWLHLAADHNVANKCSRNSLRRSYDSLRTKSKYPGAGRTAPSTCAIRQVCFRLRLPLIVTVSHVHRRLTRLASELQKKGLLNVKATWKAHQIKTRANILLQDTRVRLSHVHTTRKILT
jgi:hypothetical protein